MAGLSNKQQVFLSAYFVTWNATEAARQAGYTHPDVQGPRLLGNVRIQEEIRARLAEHAMPGHEVLERLADHAKSSLDDFVSIEEATRTMTSKTTDLVIEEPYQRIYIDLQKASKAGKLHLLKRVKTTADSIDIELYDAQAALVHLGKAHGLFTDNVNHKVNVDVTQLSDEELADIAAGKG